MFLSFSDSDLGCAAAAWASMDERRPALRLASLARLRHPMSVDLYLDRVASHARGIVVRLLGGLDYWRYGAEELAALARRRGIALALLPGDGAEDTRLAALSARCPTRRWARLGRAVCGPAGRRMSATRCGWRRISPASATIRAAAPAPLPEFGIDGEDASGRCARSRRCVFYRSHLLAADTAPIEALADALRARGLAVRRAVRREPQGRREAAAFVARRCGAGGRRWC